MDVIKIQGGLGNQMFQYAFMYATSREKKQDFQLDISSYKNYFRKLDLLDLFNLSHKVVASPQIIDKYSVVPSSFARRFQRKYVPKKTYLLERSCKINHKIYSQKIHYYDGYWQNVKYFEKYRYEILREFDFVQAPTSKTSNFVEVMKKENYCTVHIRATDYLNYSGFNICSEIYYKRAVEMVLQEFPNITFVILSDDIEYAKRNFSLPDNSIFVDWNNNQEFSWQDMYIMKFASVNIIANSTFSWWGAYLGEKKKVFCPELWCNRKTNIFSFYKYEYPDIYPTNWIKVKNY